MKKLILIRHGETDYALQRRYCGHENIPLNARGKEQARLLGAKLKNIRVDRIYSSDLSRTFETAKIAFRKRTIVKRKGLREIDFGRFSGLTFEEASAAYPDAYKAWMESPATAKIPNGESLTDFVKRVEKCFGRISDQNPKRTVALVSHGGTIRIILLRILAKRLDDFWSIEQSVTAVNIINYRAGGPEVAKINDVSHLGYAI